MMTRQMLLFSPSKILRALIAKGRLIQNGKSILRCEEWWKVCFVVVSDGGRKFATFISKRLLFKFFADDRKAKSRHLMVTPNAFEKGIYAVRNLEKESVYQVEFSGDYAANTHRITCTCDDWKNQQQALGIKRPCCKHVYATLGYLGYESLREYLITL